MTQAQVTIAGSYRKHFPRIAAAADAFRVDGARVLRPHTEQISSADDALVRLAGDPADELGIEREQLAAIAASDLLYVVNPGGYVGPSASVHAGVAHGRGLCVVCSEPPFERSVDAIISGVGNPETALRLLAEHQIAEAA